MDNGWYAGIHIKNAAQLAGYAYAMYNDWENVYRQNVYLDCDVDLGGYQALFSYISGGAAIRNLRVVNYNANSSAKYCGIICGRVNWTFEKIMEDNVSGTMSYFSSISNCRVTNCTISGTPTYAGGIVGYAYDATIEDNAVIGCSISTNDDIAGGIVGFNKSAAVVDYESTDGAGRNKSVYFVVRRNRVVNTTVYAKEDYAGGVIGASYDDDMLSQYEPDADVYLNYVQNSTVACDGDYAGGLVGRFDLTPGWLSTNNHCQARYMFSNYIQAQVNGSCSCIGSVAGYFGTLTGERWENNYVDKDYCGSLGAIGKTGGKGGAPSVTEVSTEDLTTAYLPGDGQIEYIWKDNLLPQFKDYFSSDITITTATELVQLATDVNSGMTSLVMAEVVGKQIEANKPYYVVVSQGTVSFATSTAGGHATKGNATAATTVGDTWQMGGTFATIGNKEAHDLGAYVLNADGLWHPVLSDTEAHQAAIIPPFRAFLTRIGGQGSRSVGITLGDGTTGIDRLRTVDIDGTERIYDLSGRPVDVNVKGIVVKNGKKVIIK